MFTKITKNLLTTPVQFNVKQVYNYKLTKPYRKFTDYEFEKFAYNNLAKEYRKKHLKEHIERQTLVENKFIEEYTQQQIQKEKNEQIKFRTSICKISKETLQRMKDVKEKQQKKSDKLRQYLLEQDINKMNRRKIIQMMNEESKNWITEEKLNVLQDNSLIPNYIYDETDYYLKLHEEALLFTMGDYDGMEELQSESKFVKYKNKLLMPVYQEIVSLVKHIKNNNLTKLEKEFEVARAILDQKFADFSQLQEKQKQLDLLNQSYSVLRNNALKEQKKNEVSYMHDHLLMLYNLIDQWAQYTTIIKMNNAVVEQLMNQENQAYESFKKESNDKVNTFEESLKSASENETTEDEEEIDLTKFSNKEEVEKNKQMAEEAIKMTEEQQKKGFDLNSAQQEKDSNDFDSLLNSLESQESSDKFEAEFEQNYAQNYQSGLEKPDFDQGKGYEDIKDPVQYYKGIDLENIFPRSLINSINQYKPNLKHASLENIKIYEKGQEILDQDLKRSQKKLETSVICQVYSERAQEIRKNEQNPTNQKKLREIDELLTLISEMKVEEPQFLLKVWNTY